MGDDKTPSKEWSLVDKIKETKAVVHKESSETDEKNLNKEPEKQKVKKEKMKIVADSRDQKQKQKTDKLKVKTADISGTSTNDKYLSPKPTYDKSRIMKGS